MTLWASELVVPKLYYNIIVKSLIRLGGGGRKKKMSRACGAVAF